jgi:hypothetical protein
MVMKGKKKAVPSRQLFQDPSGQTDMFEKSYEEHVKEKKNQKGECLGITFENDEERGKYFWRSFAKSYMGKRAHSMKQEDSLFHGLNPSH